MRVLMPLPARDFDPTETGVPWSALKDRGHETVFATPDGEPGSADHRMLTGEGLFLWKKLLMARREAITCYEQMCLDDHFRPPITYDAIDPELYSGILLPGGHAPGMKPYLESNILQDVIVQFFNKNKTVGAICHGVLLVARSIDRETEKSVIFNRRTTALLRHQELLAHGMTWLWLGDYFRTYPITVEDEVRQYLQGNVNFIRGGIGILRGTGESRTIGFSVVDGNFVSARWPGDVYHWISQFIERLERTTS